MHNDDTSIAQASKSDYGTLVRSVYLPLAVLVFFYIIGRCSAFSYDIKIPPGGCDQMHMEL